MYKRLLFLMFLATPLLSLTLPRNHVIYMPFVYRHTAYANACQGHLLGTVYEDVDGDGQRDNNEAGLPGIRLMLRLYRRPDVVTTVITDESGHYLLTVPPGQYELHAERPSGYRWTTPRAWGIDLVCATIPLDFGLQWLETPES